MRIRHVIVFALLCITISAQACLVLADSASSAPSIVWQKTLTLGDFANSYSGNCMIQTSDGGYALAGKSAVLSLANIGPWLVKLDYAGNQQWVQPYFSQMKDNDWKSLISGEVNSLVQTPDGGYALAGTFNKGVGIMKTDNMGNILWNQTYNSLSGRPALIVTDDGGFAMVSSTGNAWWLGKLNANGNITWNQTYANPDPSVGVSVIQTIDGGYAILGTLNSYAQAWLIKTDSSGKTLWSQTYDWPSSYFEPKSFIQTTDGGYSLAAGLKGSLCFVKTDSIGNIVWNQTYSQFGSGIVYSVIQTNDGGYALGSGFPNPSSPGNLIKLDSAGNPQWNITVNGIVCSVVQTSDGEFTFSVSSENQEIMSTDSATSPPRTTQPFPTVTMKPTEITGPTSAATAKPTATMEATLPTSNFFNPQNSIFLIIVFVFVVAILLFVEFKRKKKIKI
jgi:hypothetical protein